MAVEHSVETSHRDVSAQMPLMMRLPLLPPFAFSREQKELYDDILRVVTPRFHGFPIQRDDGALIGPFNAMLHFPMFGASAWAFNRALIEKSELPKHIYQLVVLVTGARFGARYEVYAHEIMSQAAGLSAAKIATMAAGERPADLTREEAVAYDLAAALNRGSSLSWGIFRAGREIFGDRGLAEIVFLVGCFCMVSVVLNAYDVAALGAK
jgi:4-carboxymuconolactone decarboxylase